MRNRKGTVLASCAVAIAAAMPVATTFAASDDPKESDSYVRQGFAISPVPLDLRGKNPAYVGLGSYLVNTGGCTDCHTWPNWAPGGNPFAGQPEQINVAGYMAGGRPFGPGLVSPNITPDANGLPGGLTLDQFIKLMRDGRDPDDPQRILQVMPWPAFKDKTDRDLKAMYEYLRAIPSVD